MTRFWYWLTAWWPRTLPRDLNEWAELGVILQTYYGVPAKQICWIAIAGHVSSTPAWKMRRSYAYLANVAKRQAWVNPTARDVQQNAANILEEELGAKIKELAEKEAAQGEQNGQSSLSPQAIAPDAAAD